MAGSSRRFIIFGLVVVALFILGYLELSLVKNLRQTTRYLIQANDQPISVELAQTAAARYQGLSNRQDLCYDCGMLFVFPDSSEQTFVMRNMKFPLDIIFIADNKVVKIASEAQPEGKEPQVLYESGQPVDYVLELNGGYASKNDIQVGSQIYGLNFK